MLPGQSDKESYYGLVGRIQSNKARPALTRIVSLILLQSADRGNPMQ